MCIPNYISAGTNYISLLKHHCYKKKKDTNHPDTSSNGNGKSQLAIGKLQIAISNWQIAIGN